MPASIRTYCDFTDRSQGQRILWLGKGDGTFIEQTNLGGQDGTLAGYRPNAGDFNGDGLPDILWVQSNTSGQSSGARVLWLGKGDGTFTVVTNFAGQDGNVVGYVPIVADFNGDGKADILWYNSAATRVLWASDRVTPDLLTTVTTGIGATAAVTYKLLTDSAVYTKDNTATDPIVDLQGAMNVVSRVDASNGVGGNLSSTYAYAGAKVHLDGRGFLGFREMKVTDLQTNIVQTTMYRQDFPFIGLAAGETRTLGALTLNSTTHTYGSTLLGGMGRQVFLAQSVASSADLDGSVLPIVASTYEYDSYGNATKIVVSATDGFKKTTTNTFTNDTTKWLLGRLTRATVASAAIGAGGFDTTPDAFSFTDLTNQALNKLVASNSITISGIDPAAPVSVSGEGSPQIRINGGPWVTASAITSGQTLEVRLTSANAAGTPRVATVNVGGVTDSWSVTTAGSSCAGSLVGGHCWYAGTSGASCTSVCSAHGGCNVTATMSYAGSGGSTANCQAVLTALGLGSGSASDVDWTELGPTAAAGCLWHHAGVRYRVTSPSTTCDASVGGIYRACACNN